MVDIEIVHFHREFSNVLSKRMNEQNIYHMFHIYMALFQYELCYELLVQIFLQNIYCTFGTEIVAVQYEFSNAFTACWEAVSLSKKFTAIGTCVF